MQCPDNTALEFNSCGAWDYIAQLSLDTLDADAGVPDSGDAGPPMTETELGALHHELSPRDALGGGHHSDDDAPLRPGDEASPLRLCAVLERAADQRDDVAPLLQSKEGLFPGDDYANRRGRHLQ